jgi:hypothetical protein
MYYSLTSSAALRDCPLTQKYIREAFDLALDMRYSVQVLEPIIRLAQLVAQ